jgi:hypothetical protein
LLSVGRPRNAIDILKAAQRTDPLDPGPRGLLAVTYETLGEFAQAEQEYRHGMAILPNDVILGSTAILRAMALRDSAALRRELTSADARPLSGADEPTTTDQINRTMGALLDNTPGALAVLHGWNSDPNAASAPILLDVQADWAAYFGDPELSLRLRRRMPRDNANARLAVMFQLWRPVENNVRRLPGFKDFVRELGLLDYWRTSGKWGEFCRPIGPSDFECK